MTDLKKCRYFLAFLAMILMLACKKSKPIIETVSKEEVPGTEEPVDKVFVPVKFESTGLVITIKYLENTVLLTEAERSDGNKTVVTYTDEQQPLKLEKYKNNKLYHSVDYVKDSSKIISKAILFDYDDLFHNYTPRGYYTLTYNTQNQLKEIKTYNNNSKDNLIKETARSYFSSGNLSAVLQTNYPGTTSSLNYTYDDKKGIAKHIAYNQLLALEFEDYFLMCSVNNVLSAPTQETPLENTSFNYEYNENGYPSKMVITKNKKIQNFKITYNELHVRL